MSSREHDAMVLNSKGSALVRVSRPTPTPGPHEVIIEVRTIALNPVDHIQQSRGFKITKYPYVLGFDVAGIIHMIGSSVSGIVVGDRVTAMASSWFSQMNDHGAFQQYVLVPIEQITHIPTTMPFTEAVLLPLAVFTAWFAILNLDIPRDTVYQSNAKKGILIWGVGGSVGSIALQLAKSMGFHVYATASEKHHSYLQSLGNGPGTVKLFDYKHKAVVKNIIDAIRSDGVTIDVAIEAAAGNLKDIVRIVRKTKSPSTHRPKIAAAPFSMSLLWYGFIVPSFISGVQVTFVEPPTDPVVRNNDLAFIYNTWLTEKLKSSEIVPSPKVKVVPGGLSGLNDGLAELKAGVSGVKLVLEL